MRVALTCLLLLLPVCAEAAPKKQTFHNPSVNGLPIDACLSPNKDCGSLAATKFCQDRKFGGATNHQIRRSDSDTFYQGSRGTCDQKKMGPCKRLAVVECSDFSL